MNSALTHLPLLLCSLLLVQIAAVDVVKNEPKAVDAATGTRKLGLEDYMRFTPRPTPSENNTGTAAPSIAPSTVAPTNPPTVSPTTAPPTEKPTDAPEEEVPEPPAEEETATVTEPVAEEPAAEPVIEPQPELEQWDLYSETVEYPESLGYVTADFSLYSPNITVQEMHFVKLSEGLSDSIDGLVCDQAHAVREEGPEYCAVNDEVLLSAGSVQARLAPEQLKEHEATIIALATTNVKDDSGTVGGSTSITWTVWRLSWDVLQVGPGLRKHIQDTHGELSEAEIVVKGREMIQEMMSVSVEQTLNDGTLQKDINDWMKDIMLLTSEVGEEVATYEPVVAPQHSATHEGQELETGEDGEGGGLMVILFFAGLGVACLVIVGLLYYSFRSRRSRIRRKRTIVILDDTDKESSGSQQQAAAQAAAQAANQGGSQNEPKESAQDQSATIEKKDASADDQKPKKEQEGQQHWGDVSSVGANSFDPEAEGEADVESQWGRSAAQSSAYTGSISAITGVSGLEQSDTWSVGSMSIDLAEWE